MANTPLKSIQFPGLSNTYTIPQIDNTLSDANKAAGAKATGDAVSDLKSAVEPMQEILGTEQVTQKSFSHTTAVYAETTVIPVFAKQGWTVNVAVTDANNPTANFYLYAKYSEDDSDSNIGRVKSGESFDFIAQKELESVGFYLEGLQSGTLSVTVTVTSGADLVSDIADIKGVMHDVADDVTKSFTISTANAVTYFPMLLLKGRSYTLTNGTSAGLGRYC